MSNPATALVTGGSSGIGFTISRHFARAGYRLLWVSLTESELSEAKAKMQEEFPDCVIETLEQDLIQPEGAQNVFDWVKENEWQVDLVINNAGFGNFGFVQTIELERELNVIQLNIINTVKLTRLFLDEMIPQNKGTIINISSISSFMPTPKLTNYGASKAYLTHFTRSISEELKMQKSKVKVICVCPAAISDTNFKRVNHMERVKTYRGLVTTTAEEVGRDVWRAFQRGKNFMVSGWKMRLLYFISPLIPYSIEQFLVRMEVQEDES